MYKKGLDFLQVLGLNFIVLKLTDNISWSWFWVLSPFVLWFFFDYGGFVFYQYKKNIKNSRKIK